jgi:hypothetical protein
VFGLPGDSEVFMSAMRRNFSNLQGTVVALAFVAGAVFGTVLYAQSHDDPSSAAFPDTAALMTQVVEHQKKVEALLCQYTFTDKTTDTMLDKEGNVRSRHTDTYYVTPTPYEFFSLHISHDGKPVSQDNLERQMKKIEQRMKEDEHKAQKNETIHPKGQIVLADIITRSDFTPLRWEQVDGLKTIVYSFAPRAASRPQGDLTERIVSDLKGRMWISSDEKQVVRIEFSSVSPLNLGLLGTVKGFEGSTEQQAVQKELWRPVRQEYVANGRELFKGFRIREVSEFSDYLKATTDVFQQVHSGSAGLE